MAKDTKEPYGPVSYADDGMQADGKKRYPVDTAEHCRSALAYFSKASNQEPYTASQVKTIMARIKAACRKFGIEVSDNSGDSGTDSVGDLERCYTGGSVELRSRPGGGREIGGYAATFNTVSRHLGFGHERIAPSFFNESRRAGFNDVVCRLNHDSYHLLGTVFGNSLTLSVDGIGLDYTCDVAETRSGDDVLALVQRRDIHSSSFAFNGPVDEWTFRDGQPLRTLISGHLYDVAPVSGEVAAYPNTSATLRSLARHVQAPVAEIEKYWRAGELRRLFERTDIDGGAPAKTMTGAEAYARTMSRRCPAPPGRATMTGMEALDRTQRRRYPPTPSQTAAMSHAYYKRRLLLTAKRIGW